MSGGRLVPVDAVVEALRERSRLVSDVPGRYLKVAADFIEEWAEERFKAGGAVEAREPRPCDKHKLSSSLGAMIECPDCEVVEAGSVGAREPGEERLAEVADAAYMKGHSDALGSRLDVEATAKRREVWMPIERALVAQDHIAGPPEDNHDPHVTRAADPEDVALEVLRAAEPKLRRPREHTDLLSEENAQLGAEAIIALRRNHPDELGPNPWELSRAVLGAVQGEQA